MEEKSKVYTIDDIARELGVSKTTVSRAISGKGRISRETRDRVQTFIIEHGYRPNSQAKALAQRKTYNIGLILPSEYEATEFRFFRDCMNGICEEASGYNYDVIITMTDGYDLTQICRMTARRKVDGLILTRSTANVRIENCLKKEEIPFVVIGPSGDPEVLCVDNQNQEASREITGIMLMKGMRRLALFGGRSGYLVTESRLKGFLQAHRDQGIEQKKSLIFLDVDSRARAARALVRALEEGADGIVCMDDFITGLALGCLREKGIRIPSEMKLASLYDSPQLENNMPPVTSLWFDTRELGRNACRMLLRCLGEDTADQKDGMNYQVILRESTQ